MKIFYLKKVGVLEFWKSKMSKNVNDAEQDMETRKKLLDTQKSRDSDDLKRIYKEMPLTADTTCGIGCLKGSFMQK